MKTSFRSLSSVWFLAGIAVQLAAAQPAAALAMRTYLSVPYQVGTGAGVKLGHMVTGSTDYNRLSVAASYIAQCASPEMMPTQADRNQYTENFLGGLALTTNIPQIVPSLVNMAGFYSLTRGTTVACTYDWTATVIEGGYTWKYGFISYQTGNGQLHEGGTLNFTMSVPDANDDGDRICIP